MRTSKLLLVLGLALATAFAAMGPATAQEEGASGSFSLNVHAHSSGFGSPSGAPTLFTTDPLSLPIAEGPFSYSAIPCDRPAPFNDFALVFDPDYPGIDSPASVRHLVEAEVTSVAPSGDRGTVEGTIETSLCEGGEEGDTIFLSFEATFRQTSRNGVQLGDGTFEITGGTGRFEDMTGSGSILKAGFTCLPPVLARNGAADCVELGAFSDTVFRMRGTFQDPTVATA